MSPFIPRTAGGEGPEPDHPRLHQRPVTRAESRSLREVHAAKWRARELAEAVFGDVCEMGLIGMRPHGPLRGLLRFLVPFDDPAVHRDREARFMAAVHADPLLSSVRLVYVIGPDERA